MVTGRAGLQQPASKDTGLLSESHPARHKLRINLGVNAQKKTL